MEHVTAVRSTVYTSSLWILPSISVFSPGQNVRSWTFKVAKKSNKEIQHHVRHDVPRLDPKWLREAISLSHENHQTKHIEIIKNHRSDLIPCSNDLNCTTLLIQIFSKTTTQQDYDASFTRVSFVVHPLAVLLGNCPVLNGLNRHGRIRSCIYFKGSIIIWILARLANLLQQPIKAWFVTICWQPLQILQQLHISRHWDCCILSFDRVLDPESSND